MKTDESGPSQVSKGPMFEGRNSNQPASKWPQVPNAEFWKLRVWKLQVWEAERTNAAD
jgi:hypothetical protein